MLTFWRLNLLCMRKISEIKWILRKTSWLNGNRIIFSNHIFLTRRYSVWFKFTIPSNSVENFLICYIPSSSSHIIAVHMSIVVNNFRFGDLLHFTDCDNFIVTANCHFVTTATMEQIINMKKDWMVLTWLTKGGK